MSRLFVVLGLLGVMAVGFVRVWRILNRWMDERAEVEEYLQAFGRYRESGGRDNQAYGELIARSYRIQELLSHIGVMAFYRAPFGDYTTRNYNIILNAVPAMHRDFGGFASRHSEHGQMVGEALVRYMGWSADRIRNKHPELRNPIVWFREGVAALLLLPIWFLRSLGLLSPSRSGRLAQSALFRLVAGAVALIGFLSALIQIILGWRQTLDVLYPNWATLL